MADLDWVESLVESAGDRGATAVEYAIMAGFIAVVIVAAVALIAPALIPFFTTAAAAL